MPTEWNELTPEQLLTLATIIDGGYSEIMVHILFLRSLTGAEVLYSVPQRYLPGIVKHITWCTQESNLYVQKFPEIEIDGVLFYGTDDALCNATFDMFYLHAEPAYYNFVKTQNIEYLNLLCASLYFRAEDGIFAPEKVKKNMQLFAKVPREKKIAISLFFSGCKKFLHKKFPFAFVAGKGKNATTTDDGFSSLRLLDAISAGIANNENTKKANLYEVLVRIEKSMKK